MADRPTKRAKRERFALRWVEGELVDLPLCGCRIPNKPLGGVCPKCGGAVLGLLESPSYRPSQPEPDTQ